VELTSSQKQALRARAHALKARTLIGRAGLTDAVIARIRDELRRGEILKLRLPARDGDEAAALARRIADAVPCALVGRIGFVATFHLPRDDNAAGAPPVDHGGAGPSAL
jgi:RNA-binding protein